MEETFIKRLMASTKCGICGQRYEIDNINVLSHHENLWFLRTHCSACHTQCLVAAVVKEDRAPKVITDLTRAELDRFKNMGVVTADEVLEIHNFLKDFNGDFSRLFSRHE